MEELILTSKGYIPLEKLKFEVTWVDNEKYTTCTESYYFEDELVKQSGHTLSRQGLFAESETGSIG